MLFLLQHLQHFFVFVPPSIRLDPTQIDPVTGVATTVGSWLVKITASGGPTMVSYSTLIPDAPATCIGRFPNGALPWPATPDATPSTTFACGIARPGLNVAPAMTALLSAVILFLMPLNTARICVYTGDFLGEPG